MTLCLIRTYAPSYLFKAAYKQGIFHHHKQGTEDSQFHIEHTVHIYAPPTPNPPSPTHNHPYITKP